jgi:hypothetical protein
MGNHSALKRDAGRRRDVRQDRLLIGPLRRSMCFTIDVNRKWAMLSDLMKKGKEKDGEEKLMRSQEAMSHICHYSGYSPHQELCLREMKMRKKRREGGRMRSVPRVSGRSSAAQDPTALMIAKRIPIVKLFKSESTRNGAEKAPIRATLEEME